jgi:hypothetical protein
MKIILKQSSNLVSNVAPFLTSFLLEQLYYRLVREYMPQPGLMKMRRTFRDEICLSSDLSSVAFAYFLSSAQQSLKCGIQCALIQIPSHALQALKKLVLVSQVNPFEFFFEGRKQVQVTSGQIM